MFSSMGLAAHRLDVILDKCGVGSDRLQRARHNPVRLAPPRRLGLSASRRLALWLAAGMLARADSRVRTEPVTADGARSLAGLRHRDPSSPCPEPRRTGSVRPEIPARARLQPIASSLSSSARPEPCTLRCGLPSRSAPDGGLIQGRNLLDRPIALKLTHLGNAGSNLFAIRDQNDNRLYKAAPVFSVLYAFTGGLHEFLHARAPATRPASQSCKPPI